MKSVLQSLPPSKLQFQNEVMNESVTIIKTSRVGALGIALHLKGDILQFPSIAKAERVEYHMTGSQAQYVTLSELLYDRAYADGLANGLARSKRS